MRSLALIIALPLLVLLAAPRPCVAAPPRPLITLATGDAAALKAALDGWLKKLPPGGLAMLPSETTTPLKMLSGLSLSGPASVVLLGKGGNRGGGLAMALTSKKPAVLKKQVAAMLAKGGQKNFRLKIAGGRVYLQSTPWAGKWLRARAAKLEAPLKGDAARFLFRIHLDAFVPGAAGQTRLHPLELSGQLPNDWSYVGGPQITAALKPLLTKSAPKGVLGLLPGGLRLACSLPMAGLNELFKNFGSDKFSHAGDGHLMVARLPDSPTAMRVGLYWHDDRGGTEALAKLLYDTLSKRLPNLSKSLDAKLKLQKVKGGGYALIYPVALAHRAAMAALGVKVPYPLILQWRAMGNYLILANDPLFLKPKEGLAKKLPDHLNGAAAYCWMPQSGRTTRVVWQPSGVRMESDALTAGEDLIEQSLLSVPATLLSGMIKQKVVEVFRIPAGSMKPAIMPGDHIWVDRRTAGKLPRKGDIVVFTFPEDPGRDLLKRVVALPGEMVQVKGKLGAKGSVPIKVPPGHVFVMGDNLDNSYDSRHFGPVKVEAIKGQARSVFWSSDEKGRVRWGRIGKIVK